MRVGVILSGCGVFDGSEIHEAVCLLLALDQRGIAYDCLAPAAELEVIDHRTQKPTGEKRSVLAESARIARGPVRDLSDIQGTSYDAFLLPGGFGAAKNLCDFAIKGADCQAHPEVERVLLEARQAGRPLGFACIAPALAARVFGNGIELTIGHDAGTAAALAALGAKHTPCNVAEVVVDAAARVVTTPAYMEAKGVAEVYQSISKMVEEVLKLMEKKTSG